MEVATLCPDSVYESSTSATGQLRKLVITPEFNYRISGASKGEVPAEDLASVRAELEFNPICIAEHPDGFAVSPLGTVQKGNITVDRLQISKSGNNIIWEINSQTGRLLLLHPKEQSFRGNRD